MELNSCLPEIFCIREKETFKVFENTIEQSLTYVNVLIPAQITPANLILCETPHQKIMVTFVRKWNGRHSRSCHWKFVGPYLKTQIGTIIPLVEFSYLTENTLPFNSTEIRPVKIRHAVFDSNAFQTDLKSPG